MPNSVLTWPEFESQYVEAGEPSRLFLGDGISLSVIPSPISMFMRIRANESARLIAVPSGLVARYVQIDQERFIELFCSNRELFRPFFSLCLGTRDLITSGLGPYDAIGTALEDWRNLLSQAKLSKEEELGLWGELLVLEHIAQRDPARALDSWTAVKVGGELHDFRIFNKEVEVKTTTGERRQHWITHVGQLSPSAECNLYLCSIQAQACGSGTGRSVDEIARSIELLVPHEAGRLKAAILGRIGGKDPASLSGRWVIRSQIELFAVDSSFPALTPANIEVALGHANLLRLRDVKYLIDITDLIGSVAIIDFCDQLWRN